MELNFGGRRHTGIDCDLVVIVIIFDFARAQAGIVKTAEAVGTLEETIVDPDALIAPAVNVPRIDVARGTQPRGNSPRNPRTR